MEDPAEKNPSNKDNADADDDHGAEERSSSRHRDSSRKRHRRRRSESPSSSSSSSSSSCSDDRYSRKRRKHSKDKKKKHEKKKKDDKKTKKHSKDKKKHKKESRRRSRSDDIDKSESPPSFGKYGIIRSQTTLHHPQHERSFEMWMLETKGIHIVAQSIPKYELKQHWDEYREDFNTATLPHKKYYHYETWELEQQQKQSATTTAALSSAQQVEYEYQLKRQQTQVQQQRELLQSTMTTEKVNEMKELAQLRTEMQVAYQRGDTANYQRLKDKVEGK